MNNYSLIILRAASVCVISATLIACQSNPGTKIEESTDAAAVATISASPVTLPTPAPAAKKPITAEPSISPIDDLWDRIRSGFQLQEFYYHPDVSEQLETYTKNQAFFDLTIERAKPFLHPIVVELEARGLPMELALLPFVESAFNTNANSSEQAAGIWQFMRATAASLGLQRDWWYDARRDPQASTIAALDYLEELLQLFDQDWLLALAAYNAGDGNVRRAVRRSKSVSGQSPFWDLALPRETRWHVPRVLAISRLVNDIENYDITLTPIPNVEPLKRVEVGAQIDLAHAAQLANVEYAALREFNPGYLQWATHPDQPQHILLPHAQALLLEAGLAQLQPGAFLTWDRYQIQSGDTLAAIANRFGTKVDVLQRVNNLRGSQIIAGRSLLIPRGPNPESPSTGPNLATATLRTGSISSTYSIRSGDSLWSIARRFDLHSADIALWNGIELDAVLRTGQVINLNPATEPGNAVTDQSDNVAATYIVRAGDSMASIAARFNTNLQVLLENNNLDAAGLIFPGQLLHIHE
ncbi:MAG: LysM peptidoglycan-binding domain-containing protein [Gammaproteobacteria bacterium]|nr:LysM peptidoglycan-binding domain-containing protein [Gammaproteobacteria bacterium]